MRLLTLEIHQEIGDGRAIELVELYSLREVSVEYLKLDMVWISAVHNR